MKRLIDKLKKKSALYIPIARRAVLSTICREADITAFIVTFFRNQP
jgi:hypothetical protein